MWHERQQTETRFNRYIVECKVKSREMVLGKFLDLIDTLWNVKEYEPCEGAWYVQI